MMVYYDDNTGEQLNLLRSWLKFNEESFKSYLLWCYVWWQMKICWLVRIKLQINKGINYLPRNVYIWI